MAEGQKRSGREAKKPKADKKKNLTSTGTVAATRTEPKTRPGAATARNKK